MTHDRAVSQMFVETWFMQNPKASKYRKRMKAICESNRLSRSVDFDSNIWAVLTELYKLARRRKKRKS